LAGRAVFAAAPPPLDPAVTPLRPVAKDRFVVDDLELAFERDSRGRVRGFRLSQDRIRDIGFTRQSDLPVD
jgi:hypothetical protein